MKTSNRLRELIALMPCELVQEARRRNKEAEQRDPQILKRKELAKIERALHLLSEIT